MRSDFADESQLAAKNGLTDRPIDRPLEEESDPRV